MGAIAKSIDDLIGNTPLIDLSGLSGGKATILGKVESGNPGGSIKDRIAKAIIDDAEQKGTLKPGATIIEPTSGNTGVGLAMIAASRGYRFIAVMPDSMSMERRNLMTAYGAELELTPGADGMKGAVARAQEMLDEDASAFGPRQFDNPVNPATHYATTGPEIWEAVDGNIDAFVAGVGTGGTLSGVGRFLREKKPDVHISAVEPAESRVLAGRDPAPHGIQGIGAGFIPGTLDTDIYDEIVPITTDVARDFQQMLAHDYGLLVGFSSGAAAAAATRLATRTGFAGCTIVCVLPDTGERYLSLL